MTYFPTYMQKAMKYDPIKHKALLPGRYIQQKLDGVGCQAVFNDGDVQIYSMSKAKVSQEFTRFTPALRHITGELQEFVDFEGIIQGELITDSVPEGSDRVGFITGVLHSFNPYERQKGYPIKLVAFELPSSQQNYASRYVDLQYLFDDFDFEYCSLNPILAVNDKNNVQLDKYFEEIVQNGGEGIVAYDPSCYYKHSSTACQRNEGLLKLKAENEREVLCLKFIEGEGKFKGTLGSMLCQDGEGRTFNIGSFIFNNAERNRIWNNVEPPVIVEMLYYEQTPESYKVPRCKRVREDKPLDDWNPE